MSLEFHMAPSPEREALWAAWAARLGLRRHGSREWEESLRAYARGSAVETWFSTAVEVICSIAKAFQATEVTVAVE
eukprot:3308709-Alexandrium_andersonii.AAC.1